MLKFKHVILKIAFGFAIGSFLLNFLFSIGIITQESEMYFGYTNFKKEEIMLDTLQCEGSDKTGKSLIYVGYTKNKKQEVIFFSTTSRSAVFLNNYFKSNAEDFKGKVFVLKSNKYDKIYFYESELSNLNFYTLWRPRFIDLFIFLCFYINLLVWYCIFRKELFKYNLTVEEFNKMDKCSLKIYLQQFKNTKP